MTKIIQLHKQVHYYSERFEDFNDTLSKSNEAISGEFNNNLHDSLYATYCMQPVNDNLALKCKNFKKSTLIIYWVELKVGGPTG